MTDEYTLIATHNMLGIASTDELAEGFSELFTVPHYWLARPARVGEDS